MGIPVRKTDQHYTYRDYRQWDEDERWELIHGVAYNMSPAPRIPHQGISGEIYRQLANFLKGKPCTAFLAAVDVFFPPLREMDEDDVDTVVQPDVLVVCDKTKIRNNGIWGAPDLVVEILSKSTSRKDQHEKFDLYERGGVREYWIVDPNGKWIQQYLREASGKFGVEITFEKTGMLASAVLTGFELDVGEVFLAGELPTPEPSP